MKKIKIVGIFFVALLVIVTIQSIATAVDCDGCWDLYYALKDAGYSTSEIKDGLRVYDCDECTSFSFLYGSSGSSSSSGGNGGVA